MTKLISGRVKKIPSANVSASRYEFLKLSEAEPDLGLPSGNGYVLSGNVDGTRRWVLPLTAESLGNLSINLSSTSINALADVDTVTTAPVLGYGLIWNGTNWVPNVITVSSTELANIANVVLNIVQNSIVANVANTVSTLSNFTTANLVEGLNLYFNNTRVYANVTELLPNYTGNLNAYNITANQVTANIWNGLYTANVVESVGNLYYTNARARAAISAGDGSIIYDPVAGTIKATNSITANIESTVSNLTTANVREVASNLYYTNARSYANLSAASINALSDVDTVSVTPQVGYGLTWNGTNWVPNVITVSSTELSNVANTVLGIVQGSLVANTAYFAANATLANIALTANIANTVLTLDNFTTSNLREGANLYFTNTRVYSNVSERLLNLDSNIIPAQDEVYNLGSPTRKFKDLYLSGFTLNLGTTVLSSGQNNSLAVFSLIANNVTSNIWTNLYTANVIESTSNLYFTNARVYANIAPLLTTANVQEIASNLYFTNARVYANISPLLTTANVREIASNLYFTNARVYANIAPLLTTANIAEVGSNIYYNNTRVYSNVVSLLTTYTGNISAGNIITGGGGGGSITGANLISANTISATTWTGLYTSNVIENAGLLYYTNARVASNVIGLLPSLAGDNITISANGRISANATGNISVGSILGLTTANVSEAPSNLYYTNARVYSNVVSLLPTYTGNIAAANVVIGTRFGGTIGGANLIQTNIISATTWTGLYTSNVIENAGNLYYTNARVYSNVIGALSTYTGNLSAGNIQTTGLIINGFELFSNNDISVNRITANIWNGLYTANIVESANNLYFTNARTASNVIGLLPSLAGQNISIAANGRISAVLSTSAIGTIYTSNVIENGDTTTGNVYFTNARARASISAADSSIVYDPIAGTIRATNSITANIESTVSNLTTANVTEVASNLYYTNARARLAISSGTGVSYNATTGQISIGQNVGTHANVTFGELNVTGNLNVFGNVVGFYANTLVVNDPLIQLGVNNPSDSIDIGFIGHYNDTGTERHAGLFRDASDKKFKFFDNITGEPSSTTVDTANTTFRLANVVATTFEGNVVGNVTGFVSSIGNFSTTNLAEGTQLYYTNARVYSNVAPLLSAKANVVDLTTANVVESASNLYFTNARVYANVFPLLGTKANVVDLTTANVVEVGSSIYYTNTRVYSNVAPLLSAKANVTDLTTANVTESAGNLYYTNARVYANVVSLLPTYAGDITASNITVTSRLTANAINATSIYGSSIGGSITGANLISTNNMNANILVANALYTNTIIGSATGGFITGANLISTNIISATTWIGIYTSNVTENAGLLYYTNARVSSNVIGLLPTLAGDNITIEANGRISAASSGTVSAGSIQGLNTANVNEFGNLYYTNTRVYTNIIALLPTLAGNNISISANGVISANVTLANLIGNITVYGNLNATGSMTANNIVITSPGVPTITSDSNIILSPANALLISSTTRVTGNIFSSSNVIATNYVFANGIVINGQEFVSGTENVTNINATNVVANTFVTNTLIINGFELFSNNDISVNRISANIWANLYTSNVIESASNLYFTNARVYANIAPLLTTANILEVGNNIYYTNARVYSNVITLLPTYTGNITAGNIRANTIITNTIIISGVEISNTQVGANININSITANIWNGLYTANIIESASNLYFTNARTYANVISLLPTYTGNITASNIRANTIVTNTIIINGVEISNTQVGANININSITANIWNGLYTSNVIENAGLLYYTNARVYSNVSPLLALKANVVDLTTANVIESNSNLYYTNARVYSNVFPLLAAKANVVDLTTANVVEVGSAIYYTNTRVYSNVVALLPVYTGNISASNMTVTSLLTANAINVGSIYGSATGGSITGANLITANTIIADNSITTLNLAVANIITGAGSGGYITGANLISTNNISSLNWIGLYASNVIENGTTTTGNVFFTNSRARAAFTAGTGITIDYNTGVITSLATGTVNAETIVGLTTSNIAEGGNLYYTNTRVYSNVILLLPTYTGNITAGNIRANSIVTNTIIINGVEISNTQVGANININSITANIWNGLYTSNVIESASNLYYTNARVYANVLALLPTYTGNLGGANITIGTGTGGSITGANLISANIITASIWNGLYTSNVLENGNTNIGNVYFTNTRVSANVIGLLPSLAGNNIIIAANGQISANLSGVSFATTAGSIQGLNTANVNEFGNLYYTNTRVYANVISLLPNYTGNIGSANLTIGSGTGGSITGANLITANIITVGLISATGNITGANLTVTGALVANALILQGVNVTGSVLTGNLSSNATLSDTIVANSVTSNIWARLYTSNVIENGNTTSGNVYFTNARAIAAFTAGDSILIEANGRISAGLAPAAATQLAITNSQVLSGGNKNYTLASVINSANTILVSINGVVQIPAVDYTLSGGQGLVFTANTPANAAIEVKFYGYSALNPNVAVISSSSIIPTVEGQASYLMGANASQAATVMVALDGLIQRPTVDYTVNNTTITMIPAPPAGSNIEVRFFGQEAVALSAAQSTTAYISNSRTYAGGSANLNLGSNVLLARNIIVTVDGITQIPDLNYTVSGNTLSFGTSVPSISSIVEVKFFGAEAFNANLTYAMVQNVLPSVLSNDTQIRQIIRSSAYAFSRIFY